MQTDSDWIILQVTLQFPPVLPTINTPPCSQFQAGLNRFTYPNDPVVEGLTFTVLLLLTG